MKTFLLTAALLVLGAGLTFAQDSAEQAAKDAAVSAVTITPLPAQTPQAVPAPTVPASAAQVKLTYSPIVKKVAPAVVNIYTRRTVTGRNMNPFLDDPFFAPFFDNFSPMRKRVENSLGSGFIVSPTGLIVTNAHVIDGAEEIVAVLTDGREFEAKSVLQDSPSDVALLRIDTKGEDLPVANLAPSETLEVGDLVVAIGNPFGVGQTVTSGIVSALARSNTDINDYDFFIQTDAAINPGNSGGPLVNMDGGVVGVNSAIYSRSGGSLGIGFAVPSEMVQAVIAAEKSGKVTKRGVVRPWLGFTAQNVTSDIASSLGMNHPVGALVATVAEEGPAEKAGLKTGDVILSINDRAIRDADELKFRIATIPLGQDAKLKIQRSGEEQDLSFTASAPPEIPAREPVTIDGKNPLSGATLVNVSPAVIEDMGLRGMDEGVVVQSVAQGSIADRMGLQEGDGIIAVGNRAVGATDDVQAILDKADTKRGWILTLRRNGRDQTLILR
ncbi:MAG TPA: DegQ family serine endoprotease [Alphaproteobacteria bacterium]